MAGRVALVTGCGKIDGVGQGIARRLSASGMTVVVTDLRADGVPNRRQEVLGAAPAPGWRGVESLVDELVAAGGAAHAVLGDISDADDVERIVAEALERAGRIDVLVNNAGAPQGLDRQDVEHVPQEAFDRSIDVNLRGTYLMCRAVIPTMRAQRHGRIVNIASRAGQVGAAHSSAYSASKAGVIGLTRALAMDLGPWGITANAVCPGLVGTSRAVLSLDAELDIEAHLARAAEHIPVGRVGTPDDIAAAVAYFASESAGYVTGQDLTVDGGGHALAPIARPESAGAAA
ncbi:glucose 1-dehydrogenase [Leucobacter allii]|uniref:Glucose 1-dehydrogenase n=1 Tax=Leucobacter allii TaxID=2932247 RepID=A0ABY4FMA8_9MICO|nr:glucose 1-dehydrogenase [Leucobacter allii]UOQ57345.1 glucose 1-dehydrogenase [Leucobacter allii]